MNRLKCFCLVLFVGATLNGCGGGGGGSESSSGGIHGDFWDARAAVTENGCNDRISPVRQIFRLGSGVIDTGVTVVPTLEYGDGLSFGYSDANGDCVRSQTGEFLEMHGDTATVHFAVTTNCPGTVCQNVWEGTATRLAR